MLATLLSLTPAYNKASQVSSNAIISTQHFNVLKSFDRIPNKGTVGNLPVLQCCHEVEFPLILLVSRTGLVKRTLVIPHYATEQGEVIILAIRCLKYKEILVF